MLASRSCYRFAAGTSLSQLQQLKLLLSARGNVQFSSAVQPPISAASPAEKPAEKKLFEGEMNPGDMLKTIRTNEIAVTMFDKRMIVFMLGKYKSVSEVPERVSWGVYRQATDRFRIFMTTVVIVASIIFYAILHDSDKHARKFEEMTDDEKLEYIRLNRR